MLQMIIHRNVSVMIKQISFLNANFNYAQY